jgi:RNA polymerase sigma factor (TIGR02999 family)
VEGESSGQITRLLQELSRGNAGAEEELIPLVYDDLRRIAARYMRREGHEHTLQATALVHEAYLRLAKPNRSGWQNRAHFFAVAARVMRRILVDAARARLSEKRGGGATPIADLLVAEPSLPVDAEQMLALNAALDRLAQIDQRQCRMVELRFFAGMTVEETAEALNISSRTVKREWQMAKAWLYGELTRAAPHPPDHGPTLT